MTASLQNEDLKRILTRMNGKIKILLSAFETPRHVTREAKGVASELPALNNRAIELYEGATSEHRVTSSVTQTESKKPMPKDQELEVEGKASESVHKFKSDLEAALNDLASVHTEAQGKALSCSGLDEATTAVELHSCMDAQLQVIQLKLEDVRGLRRM